MQSQTIFQNKIARRHSDTQNYYMAELGRSSEPLYKVDVAEWDDHHIVLIYDARQKQAVYEFHFTELLNAESFATIMEEEVGYWDCEDYYTGENPQSDYERNELEAMKGGL